MLPITLPNVDLLSKFFHQQIHGERVMKQLFKIPPHSNASLHYLVKYKSLTFWPWSGARDTCDLDTSVPILVFLGLSVLDLGPMYTSHRQTDVRQHHRLMPPGLGYNKEWWSPWLTNIVGQREWPDKDQIVQKYRQKEGLGLTSLVNTWRRVILPVDL